MLKFMNKKGTEMTGFELMKFTMILSTALIAVMYGIIAIIMKWSDMVDWFNQKIHNLNDELRDMIYNEKDELD